MQLDAYDGNQWRIDRLNKCARIACAIMGISRDQLEALVSHLSDSKGELVITWRHDHTKNQEIAFQSAWAECGERNVQHKIDGVI